MSHDRIHAAIDRAVRDMMQIDPRPGLRRRVLSRLEKSGGATLAWSRSSWLLVPAALVMVVAVALVLDRGGQNSKRVAQSDPGVPATPVTRSAPPAPSRSAAASDRQGLSTRSVGRRSDSIFGSRRDRLSAATIDRAAAPTAVPVAEHPATDALAPSFPAIVITPLAPLSEIRVTPLEIQPLTLPALSPPR